MSEQLLEIGLKSKQIEQISMKKSWNAYKAKVATFNLPVDMIKDVSLHHLLLRSSQELSSANPGPDVYKRTY